MANKETENCEKFKTMIGGQALIEGIMMRGPEKDAIVIRGKDGLTVEVSPRKLNPPDSWKNWPFIRGIFNFFDAQIVGVKALLRSADLAPDEMQEEPSKFDKWLEKKLGSEAFQKAIVGIAVAMGLLLSIGLFFLLPAIGISSAIQPIISYNYGARNYHRVVDTLKTATVFAVAMLTAGWIIILIFAEPLCKIFGCTGETLRHAAYTMRVYNLLLPLVPFGNVGSGFFQSIGQPKKSVFISLSRQILCLVPMVLILGSIFGQNGVLYALPVADVVSSAVAVILMVMQCRHLRQNA